jgi:hypothetical protein
MNPPTIPDRIICLFFMIFLKIDPKDFCMPVFSGILIVLGNNANANTAKIIPAIERHNIASLHPMAFTSLAVGKPLHRAPNVPIMFVIPANIGKYLIGKTVDAICMLDMNAQDAPAPTKKRPN